VLGLAGPDSVGREQILKELGLDSLSAVEVRSRLAAQLQEPLPSALLFDYPTAQQLAEYMARRIAPATPEETKTEPHTGPLDLQALSRVLATLSRTELETYGFLRGLYALQSERVQASPTSIPPPEVPELSTESLMEILEKRYGGR